MNYEIEISKKIYQNSIIFLKDGIYRLINQDNTDNNPINYELLILTCTSFHISLELAMKALLIEKEGVKSIISLKNIDDEVLIKLFSNNELKVEEFYKIKNKIKKGRYIKEFQEKHYQIIDSFQKYRNRIVHFSYNFTRNEEIDFRDNILFYLIHIIVKILEKNTDKPSEFFEYIMGQELYNRVISYKPYINAMELLAKNEGGDVIKCVVCNNITLNIDEHYCYCCNLYVDIYNLIKCDICKKEKAVIYDNLNIEINDNEMPGKCLNCGADFLIYECPKCNKAYIM